VANLHLDDGHEGGSPMNWVSLDTDHLSRPRFVVTDGAVKCIVETVGVN
jgi:hypothetical protein